MTVSATVVVNLGLLAAAFACLFQGLRSARREARERAMSIRRLCSTPTLALTAFLACFLFPIDYPHDIDLCILAFAAGFGIGAICGNFVLLQVD